MPVVSEKIRKELIMENEKYINGFLIYLDIKDSTKRKKEYDNLWFHHTKQFYAAFSDFASQLEKKLPDANRKVDKFMGDGAFTFFKISYFGDTEKNIEGARKYAGIVFDSTLEFINEIHECGDFCGLRLKAIITYLTNIQVLKVDGKDDILGRGIDFTFRLDKFADLSHTTVNGMMADALRYLQNDNKIKNKFEIIEVKKKVRGWDNPEGEKFCILTNSYMIEEAFSSIMPSSDTQNVNLELMKHYVNNKKTGGTSKTIVEVDDFIKSFTENEE